MFDRRRLRGWRRWFYWARYLARLELSLVALLIAIPIFFSPFIAVDYTDYVADHPDASYAAYQYKQQHQSVAAIIYRPIHLFIESNRGDIDAFSTFTVALFTIVLAWSTIRLWKETERLARDAVKANKFTAKAFYSEQRPWIYVDLKPDSGIKWADDCPELFADVILKNTGRTPARDVYFIADLVADDSPDERHSELIRNAADMQGFRNVPGTTLFPGARSVLKTRFYFDASDLARAMKSDRSGLLKSGVLIMHIVGSVTYKSTIDGSVGRTDFRIVVSRAAKKERPNVNYAIRVGEDVSMRNVQFSSSAFGNGAW